MGLLHYHSPARNKCLFLDFVAAEHDIGAAEDRIAKRHMVQRMLALIGFGLVLNGSI